MRDKLINVAAISVIVAAALVSGVVLTRGQDAAPRPDAREFAPRKVRDWQALGRGADTLGGPGSEVGMIEFADFECPACQDLHRAIAALQRRHPSLAVAYRHFPLTSVHPHAWQAAVASHCAAEQGRFAALHDLLFDEQSGLGTVSWARMALHAGVSDTVRFATCIVSAEAHRRVAEDERLARALGIQATPAFVVRGVLYQGAVSDRQLEELVFATHAQGQAPAR